MIQCMFDWKAGNPNPSQLVAPIKRASLRIAAHGRPIELTIWHADGTGLQVQCQMRDIAERVEVGVLSFAVIDQECGDERAIEVPLIFDQPLNATKLVIEESGAIVESGVALSAATGDEILIVAGAFPHTLAIRGLVRAMPHAFETEYPLDRYARVPLAIG